MAITRRRNKPLSQLPIYIFDKQNISIEETTNTCKEIKEQSKDKKLGLIVIDYIQLMELDDNRLIMIKRR